MKKDNASERNTSDKSKGKSHQQIDKKYLSRFGVLAGYMPQDRNAIDQWLSDLKEKVNTAKKTTTDIALQPSVNDLALLIEEDGIVRMYVTEMINQVPKKYKTVEDIPDLLAQLNYIITHAPTYNEQHQGFFPMSSLFVYMMFTPAGEAAFRDEAFNEAIRFILQDWCDFLDSPDSQYVLNTGEFGWLSPSAYEYNKLYEFVIPDRDAPHWGFASFNAYFHRQIKPELRPVADPDNDKVIVSANDGTVWQISRNVKYSDRFWIKSQPYSLMDMLNHNPLADQFVGGDVFQSFLSGADYHRWRAPISGTVIFAEVIDGLMFSELHSLGFDSSAGTNSQGYETAVNTRGLVIIQSSDPVIGLVAVMPIGITEISSVTIQIAVGQNVQKGEELGFFSYGGSSMALVFQPGAIKRFMYTSPPNHENGATIKVNSKIAEAN